jgi:hypothetical protein
VPLGSRSQNLAQLSGSPSTVATTRAHTTSPLSIVHVLDNRVFRLSLNQVVQPLVLFGAHFDHGADDGQAAIREEEKGKRDQP